MAPPWWSAGPMASWKPPARCACCWSSTRVPRIWPRRRTPCHPLRPLTRPLSHPLPRRRFPGRSRRLPGPPGRNGRRGGRPGGNPAACVVTCRSSPPVPSPELPGQRHGPARARRPPKPPGDSLAGRRGPEILCHSQDCVRLRQTFSRIALPPCRRQRPELLGSAPAIPLETRLGASPGRFQLRMPQPRRPPPQPTVNAGKGPWSRVLNRPCRSPRA